MTDDLSNILAVMLFGLLTASLIIETILSGFWNKTYFTSGLPILILRVPVGSYHNNIPHKSRLEAQFHSFWVKPLVFKQLDTNIYGFRDEFFSFRLMRSSEVMHGMLFFVHENNQVVVKGFINWFILCFSLIWVGGAILSGEPLIALGFVFFLILLMGMLYLFQFSRYSQVAIFAAQEWTRLHSRDVRNMPIERGP